MSVVGRQRLAQGMTWAARVIGIGETGLLLLALFVFYVFSEAGISVTLLGVAISVTR